MRLRHLPLALAAVTLALWVPLHGRHFVRAAQTTASSDAPAFASPFGKLEEHAKQENPSDANSVRALMDEVFDFPNSLGAMPPEMRELVEQRLTQAEMSYKFGRRPGIPEADLVELFDQFAKKLDLPESARITPHQIELLRFGIELSAPSFMGPSFPERTASSASPGEGELSPAQATFLLLFLAQQKMGNPDYDLTPEEWEKTKYQPGIDRILKYKELRDSGQLGRITHKGELRVYSIAADDWRITLSKKISQMSVTDGLDLVEEAFRMEGIQ